jgi:hypothetical protein
MFTTGPYPEPDASRSHLPLYFCNILSSIILTLTPKCSEWLLPFYYSIQNFVWILPCLPYVLHAPTHPILDCVHSNIWWRVQIVKFMWFSPSSYSCNILLSTFFSRTPSSVRVAVFWVVTPCSDAVGWPHFAPEVEVAWPSETLMSCHITGRCHNPEDRDMNLYRAVVRAPVTVLWSLDAVAENSYYYIAPAGNWTPVIQPVA